MARKDCAENSVGEDETAEISQTPMEGRLFNHRRKPVVPGTLLPRIRYLLREPRGLHRQGMIRLIGRHVCPKLLCFLLAIERRQGMGTIEVCRSLCRRVGANRSEALE